jgi:5'-nucleotidase/UDP-sugar diphosphatase
MPGRPIRRFVLILAMSVLTCWNLCPGVPPATTGPDQPVEGGTRITILHINDSHGRLEPWNNNGHSVGGWARASTLIKEVRAAGDAQRVFLVHAGDEFSKGDELTTKTAGEANIAILNQLKFDLWTPGNGDFYDGLKNIQARMSQAAFPALTANVLVKSSGQLLGRPFVILKVDGVRVAFLGLCYIVTSWPSAWPFKLDDPIETAKKYVPQLRKQADVVVLVTHIGYENDLELAKAVPGIDVIIGGHSHTVLKEGEVVKGPGAGEALVCQAGVFLEYVGRVDLVARKKGDRAELVSAAAKLVPLDEKIKLDPEITALVAKLSGATSQPAPATTSRPAAPVGRVK